MASETGVAAGAYKKPRRLRKARRVIRLIIGVSNAAEMTVVLWFARKYMM